MFFAMTLVPFNEQFAGACARRCVNTIASRVTAAQQPVMPTFSGYSREEPFTRERCETVEKTAEEEEALLQVGQWISCTIYHILYRHCAV